MTAVISQPHCYPWMGYMKMLAISDVFILRDDVQVEKQSWQTRNRIKGPNGPIYLSVPIHLRGNCGQKIKDVRIDNSAKWQKKHINLMAENYRKAPHYDEIMAIILPWLRTEWDMLMDFTVNMMLVLCGVTGIHPNLKYATDFELAGNKTDCLVHLCRQFGADRYVSANGSAAYIEDQKFADAGIKLEYLNYKQPEYPQQYSVFLPQLSVLDLLFNVGPERAGEIIVGG